MSHAEQCPICLGKGEVENHQWYSSYGKKCHGCNGMGWVTVCDTFSNGFSLCQCGFQTDKDFMGKCCCCGKPKI
jgi:DnaJ-class molecular chaperone